MWDWLNRDLLPIKAHYFLFNAGTAPVQPFMTVFIKQLGFSSSVVGIIYAILPVVGMLSKLGIGAVADSFRMRKSLFIGFLVLGTISFFGVQFVPPVQEVTTNKVELHCGAQTELKVCSEMAKKQCIANYFDLNNTMQCFLSCDLNNDLLTDLCKDWRLPQLCNFSIPGHKNSSISFNENQEPKLKFTADVPLIHTVQFGECVFLVVKKAMLADLVSHVPYCDSPKMTKCEVICSDETINQLMRNVTTTDDVAGTYQLWLLFWLLVLSWVGMAVVVSLSDAICFELLGVKANLYGQQRLWGSIGWGLLAVFSGLLVDYFSEGEFEKNYTPAFYLLLILWSADIACTYNLRYQQTNISRSVWSDVGKLLVNPHILVFLMSCIVVGMCTGLQWSFLYWYLEELALVQGCGTATWIKTLQGLVSGVQCFLGELPYFFLSGIILQKLGHVHCMSLILFFLAIRLLLYSVLVDPWWTLPIELFQGVYGLFYPTMASYANAVAPPGTEATVQGLVGAVFEGIGVALGSLIAGIYYSGAVTFRIFGTVALLACFLHIVVQYFLAKRSSHYSPKDSELEEYKDLTSESSLDTIFGDLRE